MYHYYLGERGFEDFLENLLANEEVIGPVSKKIKFVFDKIKQSQDLRLDYDVTILPPKKVFFPPEQTLFNFDGEQFKDCLSPKSQILFGVHFYDIKAIDMLDFLFKENNSDCYYLANREKTTIVGANIRKISPRAFWGTVGYYVKPTGQDAFLTKLSDGYHFEVNSEKGIRLLKYGNFIKARREHIREAHEVNDLIMDQCREEIDYYPEDIASKAADVFRDNDFWSGLAEDCFSCGQCNIVCPTCYCFDIEDKWNLDQISGSRVRYWDACLNKDFAKVSLGEGKSKNFREEKGLRFRHRIMRKAAYLNKRLGGPACVGCGRCSQSCPADIADPAEIIAKMMER